MVPFQFNVKGHYAETRALDICPNYLFFESPIKVVKVLTTTTYSSYCYASELELFVLWHRGHILNIWHIADQIVYDDEPDSQERLLSRIVRLRYVRSHLPCLAVLSPYESE
jgi:hypothetical protein